MLIFDQIDPTKLFNKEYIFEAQPEATSLYLYLAVVFGILVALGIGLIFYRRKSKISQPAKKIKQQFSSLFIWSGLIGLIIIFFRWQSLPYLGSRLFLVILTIFSFAWLLIILWNRFVIYPKEIQKIASKENFEKYLPMKNILKDERKK